MSAKSSAPSRSRMRILLVAGLMLAMLLLAVACAPPEQSSSAESSAGSSSSVSASASASSSSASASSSSASSSSAEQQVEVPDVKNMTLAEAGQAVKKAGLAIGSTSEKKSTTVDKGDVISQDPKAGTSAKPGTKVNLVISAGQPEEDLTTVPDIEGRDQALAEDLLEDAKLVPVVADVKETSKYDAGCAFNQSIAAGKKVKKGTKVQFSVAASPTTTVPNTVGMKQAKATNAIKNARLDYNVDEEYSDSVRKGVVIDQSLAAGSEVERGTTMTITVSLGKEPVQKVEVPNLMGYTWKEARSTLKSIGLKADYEGDSKGNVIDQSIAPGKSVEVGTTVVCYMQKEEDEMAIPDLVGMSPTTAQETIDVDYDGFFNLKTNSFHGTIVSQSPKAGKMAKEGTTITVKVDDSEFR